LTQDSYLGETGTPPSLHRYLYAYSNPTVYYDPNGHWVVTEKISGTLHGWADSVRKNTYSLNNDADLNSGWIKAGMVALAGAGGIGSNLIDAVGGVTDLVNLSADAHLAITPVIRDTQWGQDARQHMSDISDKTAVVAQGAAAMLKSSAEMWIEDPRGTLDQTRAGLNTLGREAADGLKSYGSRLADGDLNAVASASGIAFDVAAAVATMGGSQAAKAGKLGQAGELAEDFAASAARYGVGVPDAVEGFSSKALKVPKTDTRLGGTSTLGYTTPNGNVFLQPGLSRAEQLSTLRHELLVSRPSRPSQGNFTGSKQFFAASSLHPEFTSR
jgi:hypothetical protein